MDFITSAPLVAMVLEGDEAVTAARQLIGATNPLEANTGSIRGDFAIAVGQNMVHGSDSDRVRDSRDRDLVPGALIALASKSPQRRAILEAIGVPFRAIDVDVEELDAGPPQDVARENALRKARAGAPPGGDAVLGVDTVVALDGASGASPPTARRRAHARALSGRTHEVVSGAGGRARRRAGHRDRA